MKDVTQILNQLKGDDPSAAEQLLPLVYENLRYLAAARLSQEKPGQTLQATALVHEAYFSSSVWLETTILLREAKRRISPENVTPSGR